jgi:hypothetical protein
MAFSGRDGGRYTNTTLAAISPINQAIGSMNSREKAVGNFEKAVYEFANGCISSEAKVQVRRLSEGLHN